MHMLKLLNRCLYLHALTEKGKLTPKAEFTPFNSEKMVHRGVYMTVPPLVMLTLGFYFNGNAIDKSEKVSQHHKVSTNTLLI